jgi:hypothetical protein
MSYLVKNKLNIELKYLPKFIGVFENFYDNVSTHYVNLAYEYEVKEIPDLPAE